MARRLTLAEFVKRSLDRRDAQLRVAIPARVERYDHERAAVDVKPLIQMPVDVGTPDERTIPASVVTDCPVVFPGGGGFRLTFPIRRGDTGLVLFADRALDRWLAKGGEVDPIDTRMHHSSDGIFLPGVESFADTEGAHPDHFVIRAPAGDEIHLGSDTAAAAMARADRVEAQLTALRNAIEAAPVAPMDGGATFKAAILASLSAWPGNTGADAVKGR